MFEVLVFDVEVELSVGLDELYVRSAGIGGGAPPVDVLTVHVRGTARLELPLGGGGGAGGGGVGDSVPAVVRGVVWVVVVVFGGGVVVEVVVTVMVVAPHTAAAAAVSPHVSHLISHIHVHRPQQRGTPRPR